MSDSDKRGENPRVLVLADVASNAETMIDRTLRPAGIQAWRGDDPSAPTPDVLVVDVTQLRGDPLSSLRQRRERDDEAPAIVLAAHFPTAKLRDLFRLGVADVLLKPYKSVELCRAIYELSKARSQAVTSQLLARRLETSREQARRRTEEIRMLSEIGRTVVSLESLEDILTRVVEAAAFLTDAEEANIYLAEQGSREVVLRASKSAGKTRGTLERLRITDTLAGQVYRTGKPVLRQPNQEGPMVKVQTGFLVQSLIKVPIRSADRIVGVLGVYNKMAPRRFSEHHVTLLGSLADWAGVALEQSGQPASASTPSRSRPRQEREPAGQARTTRVHPDVISGLQALEREISSLLNGASGNPRTVQRRELVSLQKQIREISALPMAVAEDRTFKGTVDLGQIVNQVVDELDMAAKQRGLDLIAETRSEGPRIPVDRDRVHRVVEALTAAAIRRTDHGRVSLQLQDFTVRKGQSPGYPLPEIHRLSDGSWVAIRVSDSSGGLSPDTMKALSSPKPDPQSGNLGPGLSMGEIRLIAESLDGRLWADQTPATSTITFALPGK